MASKKYIVTASGGLYLRKSASTNSSKLALMPKGTTISGTKSNGWVKTVYKSKTGYCSATYLKEKDEVEEKDDNDQSADSESISAKGTVTYVYTPYRKTAQRSAKVEGSIPKGSKVTITKQSNDFYYITSPKKGWVLKGSINITSKKVGSISKDQVNIDNANSKNASQILSDIKDFSSDLSTSSVYSGKSLTNYLLKDLTGIHGMPYHFMKTVDIRGDDVKFGRKYLERIVNKMPLILFTPGTPDFLPSFSKNEATAVLDSLFKVFKSESSNLKSILTSQGRYYTFKFAYADYYKYVNKMLNVSSIYLGIGNYKFRSSKKNLKDVKWNTVLNSQFKSFLNQEEFVAFYLDSETSISESFGNQSTASSLAGTFDQASSIAKEVAFLAGPVAGMQIEAMDSETYQQTYDEITNLANKFFKSSPFINNLTEAFTTIGKGGRLLFPEIWDGSDFTKSYDITIKLRSPDGDKFSWYINILVPLIHLIALVAPHSMGPNGYSSPFLVRAFYKGIFNCDMGIITSMNINKGNEAKWTIDGLPLEVDITITIKELYDVFFISKDSGAKFMKNTALMDYLANMCGVNINKPDLERTLEIYVLLQKQRFTNTYNNAWMNLKQMSSSYLNTLYNKYNSGL